MAAKKTVAAALKAIPPGTRGSIAPQSSGWGRISPVHSEALFNNPYRGTYGPFMPRQPQVFSDGAFSPMPPIQPVPVDQPPPGGQFADPRWWQYTPGWNLPTEPGSEGLKLASFAQLGVLANRYSVARSALDLREQEIRGLRWEIALTKEAAKAYQGDHKANRDAGERIAKLTRFFSRPDPNFWTFDAFLNALLEEIFVYDALALIFRPKYGEMFGMSGRGILGSGLDSLRLVSGPTIRPLVDLHGGIPAPPNPAYQQFLYGVPRSDYMTIMRGDDLELAGMADALFNEFTSDRLLYAPYWPRRETPYGQPPIEKALLPIISGLQKQEFQLDFFTEGCHSFDSEILTENGWKLFPDLLPGERVATRSDKGTFEWQLPTEYHEYRHDGDMVEFKNKSLDLLVTPSHRMLVKRPDAYLAKHNPRDGETGWHMRPAGMIAKTPETRWIVPVTSEWQGSEPEEFRAAGLATPNHPARDFACDAEAFAGFLGIYLAEGWVRKDRDSIFIAQKETSRHFDKICDILNDTGITWTYLKSNQRFEANNKALAAWLRENCGERAWGKKIPPEIRDYSPRLLERLLSAAMMGDGTGGPLGQRYYTTTSKRLADDIQEVFQKLGVDAWIRKDSMKEYPDRFGQPGKKRQVYVVRERMQETHWLPKPKMTDYHGMVYCVTVPNGVIYTRRNGKACWAGNSVPAVYIDVGDPNMTPQQIREFQDAMNGIAGDPAYHLKVVALPAGAKIQPQRPVDLSDSFDLLVQTQVAMAFDVQPIELGILPNIGAGGSQGPSAGAVRMAGQEARDIKSRKSTKPLLQFLCSIFNIVIQDICECRDLKFQFEGLADDEDKQAITELGVQQVQNAISSIDEVRDRLDMAPWGLQETSEPVVFTAQGPIPLSMAPQLIASLQNQNQGGSGNGAGGGKKSKANAGSQGTNSGQRTNGSASTSKQPKIRAGGQVRPNGSHPAPVGPHREAITPAHSAAAGAIQSAGPRTGGTTSRSSVAGSRKKAVQSELDSLRRHIRKDRDAVLRWQPKHISTMDLAKIADDLNAGYLVDAAIARAYGRWETRLLISEEIPDHPSEKWEVIPGPVPAKIEKKQEWPGWERDLGLVGAYKNLVGDAFKAAETKGADIRRKAATGAMYVDNSTLRSLVATEVHDEFMQVLPRLWTEAWNLGYEAAVSLVTGKSPDWSAAYTGDALDNFIATEGQHWLEQISRTGLKNAAARTEAIARTEIARAMNAAAIQAYRDNGVTHKQLLIAPDDVCKTCKAAKREGPIPLDSIYTGGTLGGPLHVDCRCVPGPAHVDVTPPQAHLGKSSHPDDDPSMVAFMLFRAPSEDGDVFLLQKRGDDMNNGGTWGLPGGTSRHGEEPYSTAVRETEEEIGDLPPEYAANVHFCEHDDDRDVHIFLCDLPGPFTPRMNGDTPHETAGWGWFTRKEIKKLPLQPNFREQWKRIKWDEVAKFLAVTENGESLELDGPDNEPPLYPAGARWPYPRRSDGAEDPHYGTAYTPEPPRWDGTEGTSPRLYEDDETDEFPRERGMNRGPEKLPGQGGRRYPDTTDGGSQSGAADCSDGTGIPPSGRNLADSFSKMYVDMVVAHGDADKDVKAAVPVTGSVPATAPKPMAPHAEAPQAYNPGDAVEQWSDADDSDTVVPVSKGSGGPSDFSDPNPVDPETVYLLMSKNFPPDAIAWVKRAKWTGPVNVPWSRIDDDDIESWAASHQPERVKEFEDAIRAHKGHVAPSILVQNPDKQNAFIVDGHHRALAHKNLGQPVLAYLGNIDAKDRKAAEEAHSKQKHGGADPQNQ